MFYPIENGTIYEVPDNAFGFIYKCWLPPEGFGKNIATGLIEKTDILCSSDVPSEQKWVRPKLPDNYIQKRKEEESLQRGLPGYVDPYLEGIRRTEWKRRLCGVWFWNYNPRKKVSELRYITGLQYLYNTYWKFQGKFMDFRIPDMELFYVISYCMEDPDCLGLNEITKRKNGKTARLGCWAYERVSRLNNHHAGLQSKTDDDAEKAFKKAVIHPWQKLPHFFRPRYDLMKGEEPNELRFFPTARRGEKINEQDNDFEQALESFFDYESANESAYDGPELHTYGADEAGKTKKPVSILERQNTVRYSTEIDYVMNGKHYYTTTVEPEKGEEENYEFHELTANSNPLVRDANNRTGTGLYSYFLPAHKGMLFDEYGYADEEKANKLIENTLAAYLAEGNTRKAASFKRKNPRTLKEAFSADGEYALYNPELLNNQYNDIAWTNKLTELGNLEWTDGIPFKKEVKRIDGSVQVVPNTLYWVPDVNGKYERVAGWVPKNPNDVYVDNGKFYPNNHKIPIGCDPFKYDKTKDKRRSNCAAFAYQMPDALFPDFYDDMFTMLYARR